MHLPTTAAIACSVLVGLLTAQTPRLVKDINPGNADGNVAWVTDLGGIVCFAADDGVHGSELWRSDGTAAGTMQLVDILPGPTGSGPERFVAAGGLVFFVATGPQGEELYRTDGTTAGSILLKDINSVGGAAIGDMIPVGDRLFFTANHRSYGPEVWVSDGTSAGTVLVHDVYRGVTGSYPRYLTAIGNTVFFQADTGTAGTGQELWKTDGTSRGTVLVKDIYPGRSNSTPTHLVAVGGTLFFAARDAQYGNELWKSDGTDTGTVMVRDLVVGAGHGAPEELTAVGDRVFFRASSTVGTSTTGAELHVSDGTAAGTTLVADLEAGPNGASPSQFVAFGQRVVFIAKTLAAGREAYVSDGTAAGTFMLQNIRAGALDGVLGPFYPVGSRHIDFAAHDDSNGRELWRTDGTSAGTLRRTDIAPGSASSLPAYLAVSRGSLLFRAESSLVGAELWQLDLGATAQPHGTGCSGRGPAPVLTASDPIRNGSINLGVATAPPNAPGMLLIGLPGGPTPLSPGCLVHLDLALPTLALPFQVSAAGVWSLVLPLPGSLPSLPIAVQAGVASVWTLPTGVALTNAVSLVPGT